MRTWWIRRDGRRGDGYVEDEEMDEVYLNKEEGEENKFCENLAERLIKEMY
jgi:hypothetical protein